MAWLGSTNAVVERRPLQVAAFMWLGQAELYRSISGEISRVIEDLPLFFKAAWQLLLLQDELIRCRLKG